MVAVVYGPFLAIPPQFDQYRWFWGHFQYVDFLAQLPGVVLIALLAPRVAYRRRDALTLCFAPAGIRTAWIIGTRLAQLPHRTWPERLPGGPVRPPSPGPGGSRLSLPAPAQAPCPAAVARGGPAAPGGAGAGRRARSLP